ncbi:MAG: sulfatase-like hydrolase/transferase, partial [Planctomycetota bacterium]
EKPFFLYVAFMAPHDPRNPPEAYRKIYYDKRPPLPKNFRPLHPFTNGPQTNRGRDESLAPWPRTKQVVSDQLCEYYGLITHLDEQVGRVVDALKKSRHAENTIVVYTADHGLAMGSHGLLGKQNIYEQSMRCPLILTGPGIPKGASSHSFTQVHDLYSTLCGFAGVRLAPGVDSKDLGPVLRGEASSVRHSMFLPFQNVQRAVNDGRWKLHIYPKVNHTLLFDLQNDPHELVNLAEAPEHAEERNRLRKLMENWRKELGDRDPLRVENPDPLKPIYDNAKRNLDRWQPKWIRDKYFEGQSRATPKRNRKRKTTTP